MTRTVVRVNSWPHGVPRKISIVEKSVDLSNKRIQNTGTFHSLIRKYRRVTKIQNINTDTNSDTDKNTDTKFKHTDTNPP